MSFTCVTSSREEFQPTWAHNHHHHVSKRSPLCSCMKSVKNCVRVFRNGPTTMNSISYLLVEKQKKYNAQYNANPKNKEARLAYMKKYNKEYNVNNVVKSIVNNLMIQ